MGHLEVQIVLDTKFCKKKKALNECLSVTAVCVKEHALARSNTLDAVTSFRCRPSRF